MPWHPCPNSRDSITAAEGRVVNYYESDDVLGFGQSPYVVRSSCRVADGQWIAWIGQGFGNFIGDGTDRDSEWPAFIASTSWAWVGYFPDDGGPPTVFDLPLEPCFNWLALGRYSKFDPCTIISITPGRYFGNNAQSEMDAWFSGALDIQVRSDGANVWVAVLAQESTMYPSLTTNRWTDRCGLPHLSMWQDATAEGLVPGSDGAVFSHTTSSGNSFWLDTNVAGQPQDDPGPGTSFRWQPARITVFSGGIGGFNKIGTVEALYNNCSGYGLCGAVEAAASPAEPGVLHVLWAEGGWRNDVFPLTFDGSGTIGQRIVYSRWDDGGQLLENDLARIEEGTSVGAHGGVKFNSTWVWTTDYMLRNDHGSPVAMVVGPWNTTSDPFSEEPPSSIPTYPDRLEFWDLSSGSANVLQTLDAGLFPTPAEAGLESVVLSGLVVMPSADRIFTVAGPGRAHFASSLYHDPTLDDGTDVYLLCIGFRELSNDTVDIAGDGEVGALAFYRIPVDGSQPFSYMDGLRLSMYSIMPAGTRLTVFPHSSDFVSDPGNVWMPASVTGGGGVYHLPRTCERTWELLTAFPPSTEVGAGINLIAGWDGFAAGSDNQHSPPEIVTDESGADWLASGGVMPPGQLSDLPPFRAAAVRAKICRCCVPCLQRTGMHVWEIL